MNMEYAMQRKSKSLLNTIAIGLVLGAALLPVIAAEPSRNALQELRCEYLVDPQGIDVENPRLSWVINAAAGISSQSAYRILVAGSLDALRKDHGDLWDSGRVSSQDSTWIPYAGSKLSSRQRVYWKARVWSAAGKASPWSEPATWSMGLLQTSDWHAKWIGEPRPSGAAEGKPLPFPWLRKTFTLSSKPANAVAYVNPLGYYELYINGKKVDDHVLSPAVSDYSKRNLYVAHQIQDYLVPGKNVVALWLGRGWYVKGHPGVIHDGPLVRAQLEMHLADGTASEVVTDESWKLRESPLSPLGRGTAFGDYGGERYDAALDLPEWNALNTDDSSWQTAAIFNPAPALTAAQMVEPNRIVETLKAVRVDTFPKGGYVIDMGKNYVGWLEFKLPAMAKGAVVKLEYSDQMEPDKPAPGSTSTRPASARPRPDFPNTANQRDEIVSNGQPLTFRSRFNYHGFRYVRVLGTTAAPAVGDAVGYFIRTAYTRAGEFTSSNELLNQIHQMVARTYEALSLGGYVVDCPTRERLGYGGDAGTSFETGMYNFSTGGLYNRWLANWRDAQAPSGSLPHTAPNYQDQGGGGPMWGGMVVTLPWQMYLQYGDRRVLETNYPMMRKWLDYLHSETTDNILLDHKSHAMSMQTWNFLGDWLTPKGSLRGALPPVQAINTVHYLYQLQLASKIARVLGNTADAAEHEQRAAAVARAIHQRFYNPADHTYTNGDSMQEAFPLLTGLVPPELRPAVMAKLDHVIRVQNGGHLDTGMHGTYFVMKQLMEAGRDDLIYEMTNKKDYPGWGYMLANGATTAWEGWTGQSHIHDTLISIGAWFYEGLGGIRADEQSPGFRHFFVKPAVVGDLTFAKAKYHSLRGEIISDWRIEKGTLKLAVTVPPGTTATVIVPGKGPIRAKAKPSKSATSQRSFTVPPGTHTFETLLSPQTN
jgi:alpha-L-rhamnosidase